MTLCVSSTLGERSKALYPRFAAGLPYKWTIRELETSVMLEKLTGLIHALRDLVSALAKSDPWPVFALLLTITVLILAIKK